MSHQSSRQVQPSGSRPAQQAVVFPHIIDSRDQFVGRIVHAGRVEVWGLFRGHLRALEVSIKEGGKVDGTVEANRILNYGTLTGTVRAQSLQNAKNSRLDGDIKVGDIGIQPGCQMGPNTAIHTPGRKMIPILTPEGLDEEIDRAEALRRTAAPRQIPQAPVHQAVAHHRSEAPPAPAPVPAEMPDYAEPEARQTDARQSAERPYLVRRR